MSNDASHSGTQRRESPVSRGTLLLVYLGLFVYLDLTATVRIAGSLSSSSRTLLIGKSLVLGTTLVAVAGYSLRMEAETE
jgi:hypothetical protein